MIEFKNLKLNLKSIDILNDISFSVPKNKVCCFVGNKNTGKSSILKIIAGVYKNFYGEVYIDGVDINDNQKIKIDIINESKENDQYLTVSEYLEFYGKIYNNKDISKYIDMMLRKFSLTSYKFTTLDNIDKETFKLIDLIRVLLNDPDIILFDNLFFSDNIDYNELLFDFIKTLVGKKTLVFTARNLNYISEICDYLGVLDNGSLITYGKRDDVFRTAEIFGRFEVEVLDRVSDAVEILRDDDNIINILYEDNNILFTIAPTSDTPKLINIKKLEYDIIKRLVDSGIKICSFKKQQVRFEHLFSRLKD